MKPDISMKMESKAAAREYHVQASQLNITNHKTMRTIESIKENEVVNATTLADAVVFCRRVKESGYNTAPEIIWKEFQRDTCFEVVKLSMGVTNRGGHIDAYIKRLNPFTITDAKEFIAPTGEAGQSEQNDLIAEFMSVFGLSFKSKKWTDEIEIIKSKFILQRK